MIEAQVGDKVTRMLCGSLPIELTVTEVTDKYIRCGDWTFDRRTGAEIDDVLEWEPGNTGSYLDDQDDKLA